MGTINRKWVEPEIRDNIINYVGKIQLLTEIKLNKTFKMIGISKNKYLRLELQDIR